LAVRFPPFARDVAKESVDHTKGLPSSLEHPKPCQAPIDMHMGEGTDSSESQNFIKDDTPGQAHVSSVPYHSTSMDVGNSKVVDAERGGQDALPQSFWTYLMSDVDPALSTGPLTAFCFMTGFMCVLFSFSSNFDESLSRKPEMRFLSQLSTCGVAFRPATLYRYASTNSFPLPIRIHITLF
jgi:hypothetical protein